MRSRRRANSSERSTCEVRTATARSLAAYSCAVISGRRIGVALVGAAGIALRVWVYRSALGAPDSDEAIVGLMARHALHGDLTVFYWGQPYGGTQEALLTAPVVGVAGMHLLALRTVTLVLGAVAAALVWLVGRRTVGEPIAAVAAALYWVWPPFDVMWLVHERGFYGSDVVYCLLLLLLALRIAESPTRVRVAVFGFVLGLAFWQTAQIVPIALPVVAWTIWRAPRCLRHAWSGLAAAAVGALPWLVWNATHDWASILPRANASQYAHSLRLFVSPLLPMLLGLRAPLAGAALMPKVLVYLVYAALGVLFLVGARRARHANASLLYAVAAAFPFIWALSRRVTSETSAPLYLVVVSPVAVLLVAGLGRGRVRAVLLVGLACVVSVVNLHRMETWFGSDRDQFPRPTPRDLTPLVETLDRLHIDRVYASYWIAFRLTFATDERIVATNEAFDRPVLSRGEVRLPPSDNVRYRPYQREVAAARHGFVFFRNDAETAPTARALRRARYRRVLVGPFAVYAPPPH